MKLNKYQDIVLVVVLLMILYTNPQFLSKMTQSVLGKLVLIVGVICLTKFNGCLGGLAGLVFISLVHTNREGLEGIVKPDNGETDKKEEKKEKEDEEEDTSTENNEGMVSDDKEEAEDEEEEEKEGNELIENVQKEVKKSGMKSIGDMNAEQMTKLTEKLIGYKDRLTGEQQIQRGGYNTSSE